MLKAITDFFSPKQQTTQTQQIATKVQKTPYQQTSSLFVLKKQQGQQQQTKTQRGQQQQTRTQQGQQQKATNFVPTQNLPPMKMTSQQLTTTTQLADAITQQVNQQARQSGQQLAVKQKTLTPSQLQQARNAHAQVLSYASQARSLLDEIRKLVSARQTQTQQSKRQLQKARKDANTILAELRVLLEELAAIRQENRQIQQRHIRQLQQIKTTLLAQAQGLRPLRHQQQGSSTKVIQHITPDGNKFKIAVDIKNDAKCCVAKALERQTRVVRAF